MKDQYGNEMVHFKGHFWTGTREFDNVYRVDNNGRQTVIAFCKIEPETVIEWIKSDGVYLEDIN